MKRWTKAIFVMTLGFLMFLFMEDTTLAQAQIRISVEEGIDGKVKEGRGFPLKVTVENTGSDFKGDLLFDYAPSFQTGGSRALSIDVPANSKRTYTLSIPGFNDEIRHNSNQETIHLFQGSWEKGKEIKFNGDKRLTPNFIYSNYTAIGLLSENPDRLKGIKGANMGGNQVETLTLTKENIPEEKSGFQMLDYLIIDQFNISELSQDQQSALKSWVETGGVLIIGGAPHLEDTLGSAADMAPLMFGEESTLSDTSTFNVKKNIEASFNSLAIYKGTVKPESDVLVEQDGIPLVVKSSEGLGEVWQTAFSLGDPVLNAWESYDEWFANVLSKTEPYFLLGQSNGDQSFLERIYYEVADSNELFPTTNFKISTLVIILIIYLIVLVPLLYFLLRKVDKREQAWWIIPVISVLVSSGIFITGAKDRISKPHLNQMSVLKVEEDKSVHGISAFSALSNSGGDYDFISDKHHLDITPARVRNSPGGVNQYKFAVEEMTKDKRSITFRDVEYWSTRTLLGTSEKEEVGRFIPELVLEDQTLSGTIQNDFPYDFTDVYIWSGSRMYRLGDMKAGDTLEVDKKLSTNYLSSPIGVTPNISSPLPNQQNIKQQKKERLENFASQMISADNENNSPVIFGYTDAEIFHMKIKNKESKSENFSLLYQHFPSLGNYKGAITLRNEQLDLDVLPVKGQVIEHYSHNGADEMGLEDGTYELSIHLPNQIELSKVTLHSLNMTLHTGGVLQFSLVDPQTDERLVISESSTNSIEVKEKLNKYINDKGEIVFEFEKRSQGDPFVRLPDIVLKGEVRP
ncbi:hypothetical protein [Rossellomorea sp. y25]|uniref:hypothetical protein n=1 Tax=Rossellomorea sp. y25 TaxID=3118174 RepID=UPI00262C344C|nr:hypothetical protein [uncultured Rossellomorea sp.]